MNFNYIEFIDKVNAELAKLNIDISEAKLDHIAYYVRSSEEYDEIKPQFLEMGTLVREPLVGGRRVGVIKFHKPLTYKSEEIKTIELIEPTSTQVNPPIGLEHVEYILPVSLEDFVKKYPDINWDLSKLDHEDFPMLKLRLTPTIQVKFPRNPILREGD